MAYKTILLHVNDERRVAALVDAAAHLAERDQAHLIGSMYATCPDLRLQLLWGRDDQGVSCGLSRRSARVRAAFEGAAKGRPFVSEWRLAETSGQGVAETVMENGRAADLVIASQRDRGWAMAHCSTCQNDLRSRQVDRC